MTYEFQFVYVCTISVPVLFFFGEKPPVLSQKKKQP